MNPEASNSGREQPNADTLRSTHVWLAVLLGLLVPGLGQLYVGRGYAAVAVAVSYLLSVAVVPALALSFSLELGTTLLLWAIAGVSVWLGQAIWAGRMARIGGDRPRLWYTRPLIYLGFWMALALLSSLAASITRGSAIEAFLVPAGSMLPAIAPGDQIFVTKIGADSSPDTYGRIAVFTQPQSGDDYIKRVVALGGDTVAVRGGIVSVNSSPLARQPCDPPTFRYASGDDHHTVDARCWVESTSSGMSYRILEEMDPTKAGPDFGPLLVPADHLFVLGDNRDHSYDSRSWGPVPFTHVIGRARLIWWSWDPVLGLRSERLGLPL